MSEATVDTQDVKQESVDNQDVKNDFVTSDEKS